MEKMMVRIGLHSSGIEVEIPAEFTPDVWMVIQRQLALHFQECADRNEVSPFISGMGPGIGYCAAFEKAWQKAKEVMNG